eukprot:COSAG06_NODE_3570_length_5173_cov_15.270792_5_plen_77_part_00
MPLCVAGYGLCCWRVYALAANPRLGGPLHERVRDSDDLSSLVAAIDRAASNDSGAQLKLTDVSYSAPSACTCTPEV